MCRDVHAIILCGIVKSAEEIDFGRIAPAALNSTNQRLIRLVKTRSSPPVDAGKREHFLERAFDCGCHARGLAAAGIPPLFERALI